QEILDNEYAEIRVDTRIKTDVKIRNNRPDIFILDKKKNKITLIEVGITSQDSLKIYDLLPMIWVLFINGIVTKYHKLHLKRLEIPINTVETISFDRRRVLESGLNAEESWARASMEKREEDAPLISQGGTTLEEPTNNKNKESDLEEETKVVKEVEENI
ncbi:hypothetical protein CWI38_0621p0010, partial [Hamiltosporidium tvaerminnensis]